MKFCKYKVYIGNISISIKIAAEIQFKVIYSTKFSQKWKQNEHFFVDIHFCENFVE